MPSCRFAGTSRMSQPQTQLPPNRRRAAARLAASMPPVAGGWGAPVTLADVVVAYGGFELSEPGRDRHEFTAGASIGVALFPDDATDAKALVTAADTGMYASKRSGRGRTSFALGSRHAA
jgi:GGDEF domain-containing protein